MREEDGDECTEGSMRTRWAGQGQGEEYLGSPKEPATGQAVAAY